MSTPVLGSLHVYPVKSLAGTALREMTVEPWGAAGDRRWLLVGADHGALTQREHPRLALVSARQLPGGGLRLEAAGTEPLEVAVPDPAAGHLTVRIFRSKPEAVPAGPQADAWFSAYLGCEVRLVHMDAPEHARPITSSHGREGETVSFADSLPFLLTTSASLGGLNSLIAEGDQAAEGPLTMNRFRPGLVVDGTRPWEEDGWRRVRVGAVSFRVAKPCARCVITTTDQQTAVRGREPLRTLGRHRRDGNKLLFGQLLVPEQRGTLRIGDTVEVLERAD
ncbi:MULTISPECIES: MOSC domain-containing protein [Streptomyces]|uniref:MOSC domain-containing protein n=1 Tax=Streptomyces TaxID=1883 RepID=UPI0004C4B6EF|nr:MOSC N-terminal beta barrel domain-containing protein [Streptomyces sp. NRRL S-1868]